MAVVLLDDVGRNTAAVLDLDALPLGPLADLDGVNSTAAASAAGSAPGRAAGPPGVRDVLSRRLAQLLAVRRAQIDLVFRAVKAEADGASRLAAVQVVNGQRMKSVVLDRVDMPSFGMAAVEVNPLPCPSVMVASHSRYPGGDVGDDW